VSQRLPRTTWATKPITFLSPSVTSRVEELGQSMPTQPVQEAADSVMLSQAVKWIHATTVRRLWWPLEGSSQVRSILRVEDQSALKRPIWADVDPSPGDSLATLAITEITHFRSSKFPRRRSCPRGSVGV
jgi:hypothetical protein